MAEPSAVYQGNTPAIENGGLNALQLALANYMAIGNPPPFAVNNAFLETMKTFTDPGELSPFDINPATGLPRTPDLLYNVTEGIAYVARGEDIYLLRRAQDCGPDENRLEEYYLGRRPDVAAGTFAFYGFARGGSVNFTPGGGGIYGRGEGSGFITASDKVQTNDLDAIGGGTGNFVTKGDGPGPGAGPKIICTKLYELGYMPEDIFIADQKFGRWLELNDPYAYYGYIKWASVVVDWMENDGPQCMFWIRDKNLRNQTQRQMAINWAKRIAMPWAYHMAYRMGTVKEDNRAGRLIMRTGLFVSRIIGKLTKNTNTTKSSVIGYIMWATFGIFLLLSKLKGK